MYAIKEIRIYGVVDSETNFYEIERKKKVVKFPDYAIICRRDKYYYEEVCEIIRDPRRGTEYLAVMARKALDRGVVKEKVLRGIAYRLMRYYVNRSHDKYEYYKKIYEKLRKTDEKINVDDRVAEIIEEFLKIIQSGYYSRYYLEV